MGALSLNDPPNPLPNGWENLPDDVQKQVWDSVKSGDRGCQESRYWCNRTVNKAHAQWCRDNRRWLGRCDLMRIDIDESKLEAFPLSERERSLAQALDGFMYIPTSAEDALMHHSLMSNTLVSLLRLTPMPALRQDSARRAHGTSRRSRPATSSFRDTFRCGTSVPKRADPSWSKSTWCS